MTKPEARNPRGAPVAAAPFLMPGISEFTKLMTARNQGLMNFYFDRLHQYELFYKKMIEDYSAQIERSVSTQAKHSQEISNRALDTYEGNLLQAQADAAQIIEQAKLQAERIIEGAYARAGETNEGTKQNSGRTARRKSA